MRRVIVESPLAGDVERNVNYARACVLDCLERGEAPFASHLLYAQEGILDDLVPEQRERGITAGLAWGEKADATVVYEDLGVTPGMIRGIGEAERVGRPVERRRLLAPERAAPVAREALLEETVFFLSRARHGIEVLLRLVEGRIDGIDADKLLLDLSEDDRRLVERSPASMRDAIAMIDRVIAARPVDTVDPRR